MKTDIPVQAGDLLHETEAAYLVPLRNPHPLRQMMYSGELRYWRQGANVFIARGDVTPGVKKRALEIQTEMDVAHARKARMKRPMPEPLVDLHELAWRYGLDAAQLEEKLEEIGLNAERRGSARFVRQKDIANLQIRISEEVRR